MENAIFDRLTQEYIIDKVVEKQMKEERGHETEAF